MLDPETAIRIADALEQIAATTYTDPVVFADEWKRLIPEIDLDNDTNAVLNLLWGMCIDGIRDHWRQKVRVTLARSYAYFLRATALVTRQEARWKPVDYLHDYRFVEVYMAGAPMPEGITDPRCDCCQRSYGAQHTTACTMAACMTCGQWRSGCHCAEKEALALLRRVAQEGEDHGNATE